jgi:CRP-like cAMP-binding protein
VQLLRFIAEQQFLEMERRYIQLQRDHAVKRYTTLLQQQPEYLQKIPLQYLSSYLGISQRHLSRIRKEIAI